MFDVTCLDKYGNTVTNLTQWDLNQTLYIEDHGFATPPQFHFCNKNTEKALVMYSTINDGVLEVNVPNILLTEPYGITAYVYLTEDESSKTVEYIQLPVRPRPQPNSFEYEDNTDIVDLKELADKIKALNDSISYAEEARISAETIRIENENIRIENEEARKTAEETRKSAESIRVQSENARVENEEQREASEESRASNEETRITAENERSSVETIRIANENTRESNEDERKASETERVNAETERVEAENLRVEAENTRVESESNRVIAEGERISNENTRIEAETERKNAELIRQEQETERQTNTATAIANTEKATDRANLAAEACEDIVAGAGFISVTEKGIAGGVATLDDTGKVPLEQLPDDIGGDVVPEGVTYIDFDNPTGEEVGDILPVDADTLEGHNAEYFATVESVTDIVDGTTVIGESTKTTFDSDDNNIAETFSNILNGTQQVGDSKAVNGFKIYTKVSQLGLSNTATLLEVYNAMPYLSQLECNSSDLTDSTWKFPSAAGTVKVVKINTIRGYLEFRQKIGAAFYWMGVDNGSPSLPDGIWHHVGDGGNASQLGGKDASEYALVEQLTKKSIQDKGFTDGATLGNYLDTYSNDFPSLTEYSLSVYASFATGYKLNSGRWFIEGFKSAENYEIQVARQYHPTKGMLTKERSKLSSGWTEWVETVNYTDLANYLPLSGGTVGLTKWDGLVIKRKNSVASDGLFSGIMFAHDDGMVGGIGYERDVPILMTPQGTVKGTIFHTGNKPTGTYTGNGSATERTINVGGIGYALLVSTGTGFAIVTNDGAIVKEGTTITALSSREARFNNGNLYLATTNSVLNLSGTTRYFAVL